MDEQQFTVNELVGVQSGSGFIAIRRITDITEKRGIITLSNGVKYRSNGEEITDNKWNVTTIYKLTPAIIAEVTFKKNAAICQGTDWKKVDPTTLAQVVALLKKQQSQ